MSLSSRHNPTETVTVAIDVEADAAGIMDGREVARALIRQAIGVLFPYAEACPVCAYALLSGMGFEVIKETGQRRIDAVVHAEGWHITPEAMAAHVADARPQTIAMLEVYGQTHHREHMIDRGEPPKCDSGD